MGCLLLLAFLALGMAAAWRLLPGACVQVRLWLGAAGGMMAMMWLPSLFAFFLDFTAQAQYMALAAGAVLWGLCMLPWRRLWTALRPAGAWGVGGGPRRPGVRWRSEGGPGPRQAGRWADLRRSAGRALAPAEEAAPGPPLALTLGPGAALSGPGGLPAIHPYPAGDRRGAVRGAIHLRRPCLHLGIATGLRWASYPPEYTLLPGVLLGYPFLFDALSASMLVLGCPLALSFTLPGTIAMGLVFWGFVLLAWEMTQDALAVALAYLLAFLNGGLGFAYMLDGWPTDSTMLREIFTGYYQPHQYARPEPALGQRDLRYDDSPAHPAGRVDGAAARPVHAVPGIKTRAWGLVRRPGGVGGGHAHGAYPLLPGLGLIKPGLVRLGRWPAAGGAPRILPAHPYPGCWASTCSTAAWPWPWPCPNCSPGPSPVPVQRPAGLAVQLGEYPGRRLLHRRLFLVLDQKCGAGLPADCCPPPSTPRLS